MSKMEGLRRVLRSSGWKYSEIADLEAAIELLDPSMQLAERLCSTMLVFAHGVGRRLFKGLPAVGASDGWLIGGQDCSGGPQDDPGDETMPMFPQ